MVDVLAEEGRLFSSACSYYRFYCMSLFMLPTAEIIIIIIIIIIINYLNHLLIDFAGMLLDSNSRHCLGWKFQRDNAVRRDAKMCHFCSIRSQLPMKWFILYDKKYFGFNIYINNFQLISTWRLITWFSQTIKCVKKSIMQEGK